MFVVVAVFIAGSETCCLFDASNVRFWLRLYGTMAAVFVFVLIFMVGWQLLSSLFSFVWRAGRCFGLCLWQAGNFFRLCFRLYGRLATVFFFVFVSMADWQLFSFLFSSLWQVGWHQNPEHPPR